jgi:cell division protein FtsQ
MLKKWKIKINWRKFFQITLWNLLIAAFLVSMGFTEQRRGELLCKEVVMDIDDAMGHNFVDKSDIEQIISNKFGNVTEKTLSSINISLLESLIDNNPFVLNAEVFSTIDGKLVVEVKQRNPVVRIINASDEKFYIDEQRVFMPTSDKYSAPVPIVNGNIFNKEAEQKIGSGVVEKADTAYYPSIVEKVFRMADFIRKSDFWNAQVEQIYVNANGEIEIIPRVGNHLIIFGDINDMEEKFDKLFLFYKEGLSKTGWNQYKTINLTFKGQIVCTKK